MEKKKVWGFSLEENRLEIKRNSMKFRQNGNTEIHPSLYLKLKKFKTDNGKARNILGWEHLVTPRKKCQKISVNSDKQLVWTLAKKYGTDALSKTSGRLHRKPQGPQRCLTPNFLLLSV